MSVSWLGVLKYIFEFFAYNKTSFDTVFNITTWIVFALLLFFIPFILLLIRRLSKYKIIYLFIIFLLLSSALNYAITSYNANNFWYQSEQMQLGLWFDKNIGKDFKILIDERDSGVIRKIGQGGLYERYGDNSTGTTLGFWINGDIRIGSIRNVSDFDYLFSIDDLDYEVLYTSESGIKVYKL